VELLPSVPAHLNWPRKAPAQEQQDFFSREENQDSSESRAQLARSLIPGVVRAFAAWQRVSVLKNRRFATSKASAAHSL